MFDEKISLNKIRFSDDTTATIETASSRSSKSKSVLLTPFSVFEYELATSITELMEHITAFPEFPDIETKEPMNPSSKKQKPSQALIRIASQVAAAVKKLSNACGEVFSGLQKIGLVYNNSGIKNIKSKLYSSTIVTVDTLKDTLVNGTLEKNETKKSLIEHLISVANLSNEMIEDSTAALRKLRQLEDVDNDNIKEEETQNSMIPDGEGYSVIIPAGLSDGRPEDPLCDFCLRSVNFKEKLIQYLGSNYHQKCFVCINCTMPLTHSCFLTHEGNPICRSCSPRCTTCRRPIMSDCFLALEKMFHLQCFKCKQCSKNISSEDKFYRIAEGAVCTECMSAARETVFREKWNPQMNTRFSVYLEDDSADAEPNVSESRKNSNASSPVLPQKQADYKSRASYITLAGLKSLPGVLSSEFGIDLFIKFCVQQYCVEKLFFWMDVEQYRVHAEKSPANMNHYANCIYDKYIKSGAEMEINFSSKYRKQVSNVLNNSRSTITLFDSLQQVVYDELESNTLPKFLESRFGADYLNNSLKTRADMVVTKVEKGEPMAIPDIKSAEKDPEHILTIEVTNFEKRYKPDKHYVYEVYIRRIRDLYSKDHSNDRNKLSCPLVYRKYEEFVELTMALQRFFPDFKDKIPSLSTKVGGFFKIGPSKSGKQRVKELNDYLRDLFKLPTQLVQSVIVRKFLQPNQEDIDNFEFNKRLSSTSKAFTKKYH